MGEVVARGHVVLRYAVYSPCRPLCSWSCQPRLRATVIAPWKSAVDPWRTVAARRATLAFPAGKAHDCLVGRRDRPDGDDAWRKACRTSTRPRRSSRVCGRACYVGPWLPEPVDTSADPYLGAERGEALEFAALLLMEKLTPTERAAYVLREAFDYPYAKICDILQSTEPAVRQLVSRAANT